MLRLRTCGLAVYLRRRPDKEPDPDDRWRRRVEEITEALKRSTGNLGEASALLIDLQQELAGRARALEELQKEITEHERLTQISGEASKALDELIEARMREQERRIVRVAWGQGIVFAVFGAAVAVAIVVFSHWLPTIR